MTAGGWRRTCVSPTRSGPEGSSRNEFPCGSLSGLPPFPLRRPDERRNAQPAYRVLARKYRPATFADMIGQDALVRTLTNAIASGRLAQGYMLTGVRGVGKTTTARILARAFNCIGPDGKGGPTATPCGDVPQLPGHRRRPPYGRHRDGCGEPHRRWRYPRADRGRALRSRSRRATRSTSSTKCICSRPRPSTPC